MSRRARTVLGCGLLSLGSAALASGLAFWPEDVGRNSGNTVQVLFGSWSMPSEANLLVLAVVFGAIGSFLHIAKSFASFAGNRALVASWAWWYGLQPLMGMALSLVFYVVIRGGFFASAATAGAVSPFGVAGTSALVGMFSKQATDKLNELFSALFQTSAEAARRDKLVSATDRGE
jgi:hypothetical protein